MRRILILGVTFGLLGCAAEAPAPAADAPVDTQADAAAIRALADRELELASAGDPAGFMELLAAGAVAMPPGEPAKTGAELQQWLQDFMAQLTVSDASYQHDDVIVAGDVAVHAFRFTWTITPKAGGDSVTEVGKGIHVLRRQADGSWKITHDVWNTNAPS